MAQNESEAEQYVRKATELRTDGRVEEAILAARKATSLAPDSANAWWQLAMAQEVKDGLAASIPALRKTMEFAPTFAPGWCQLGWANKKTGQLNEAVGYYERALEEDSEHVRTLKLYAEALKERDFSGDKQKRTDAYKSLRDLNELDSDGYFALAYALSEMGEDLGAAKAYEVYASLEATATGYNNLGVAYSRLGRKLDAADAYRFAMLLDETLELPKSNLPKLLPPLQQLRSQVLAHGKSYLDQDNWYKNYINPLELLGINDWDEVKDDPKALQKRKKALYHEIELEEGRISWVPGLTLDKSTAMAACEQLSETQRFSNHKAVFARNALMRFLTRGDLEHFLIEEDNPEDFGSGQFPVIWEDKDYVAWVGPMFAAQYDLVLSKALEKGHLDVLQCLFHGRRVVSSAQEDRCFEGARRLLSRLMEPLHKLSKSSDNKVKVRLSDVQGALQSNGLDKLLAALPAEFRDLSVDAFDCIRNITVNTWNATYDAEVALGILKLSETVAQVSPATKHHYDEDLKKLNEKLAESKKDEAHLNFKDKALAITKAGVSFGAQRMAPNEIVAVRWGLVYTSNSPPTARFNIVFTDRQGAVIDVNWSSTQIDEQKKLWGTLVDALFAYLIDDIKSNFMSSLRGPYGVTVGGLKVTEQGVEFVVDGWFSNKKTICPWNRLQSEISNGNVIVSDPLERKARAEIPLSSTDNGFFLHLLSQKS